MADIGAFTPEQARLLWHDYISRTQSGGGMSSQVFAPSTFEFAVLQSAISAATSAHDGPATATAKIVIGDADGDLVLSSTTVTVTNRFESISLDDDTLVVIVRIR